MKKNSQFSFSSVFVFRSLVGDVMLFPSWTSAAKKSVSTTNANSTTNEPKVQMYTRESLSNILSTHIDFRRPILHHKTSNGTKEDETIERTPETCIEEFNLYVSTWKGWLGAFPAQDNRITWEEVERENTIQGTVTCTRTTRDSTDTFNEFDDDNNETNSSLPIYTSQPFVYSLSKIPKSNLMLLYVNHSVEDSFQCSKLTIKRKPVEFSKEEWCTRLRTTPYRERPHKCFFVHDGEKRPLFVKCSDANQLLHRTSDVIRSLLLLMAIKLLLF